MILFVCNLQTVVNFLLVRYTLNYKHLIYANNNRFEYILGLARELVINEGINQIYKVTQNCILYYKNKIILEYNNSSNLFNSCESVLNEFYVLIVLFNYRISIQYMEYINRLIHNNDYNRIPFKFITNVVYML